MDVSDSSDNIELSGNNSNKGTEHCSDKNADTSCEVIRKDSTPSAVEEEDTVLGEDEPAKEFDVNFDEDELLKDTDTDDGKNENTQTKQLETNSTEENIENTEENSLDTNEKKSVSTPPDILEKAMKESVNDYINNEINCDSGSKINSSINGLSADDKNSNEETLVDKEPSEINVEDKDSDQVNLKEKGSDNTNLVKENLNRRTLEVKDLTKLNAESSTEKLPNEDVSAIDSSVEESATNAKEDEPNFSNSKMSTSETNEVSSISKKENLDNEASEKSIDEIEFNNSVSSNIENEKLPSSSDCGESKVSEELNKSLDESENENKESKSSSEEAKSNINDGTKFVHVDQDSSRNEESYETNDAGGEDPFALTCDEAMETSEKDTELDKDGACQDNTPVVVNETSSDFSTQTTNFEVKPVESVQETTTKEVIQSDGVENNDDSSLRDTYSSEPPTEEGVSICENDDTISNTENQNENNTQAKKNENTSTVKKNELNQGEVSSQKEPSKAPLISYKPKIVYSASKSKSRGRKNSSEEDSDDSDIEINPPTVKRPKRDAAKKAESQIKVLSAVEESVDGDDADTNGVEEVSDEGKEAGEIHPCHTCKKVKQCDINILSYGQTDYFCSERCFNIFRDGPPVKPGESTEIVPSSTVIKEIRSADIQPIRRAAFIRKCSQCSSVVKDNNEKTLSWETMDFCSEECLGKYQQELGSHCANCKGNVQPASLGKYCVRFGYEVKQFCCSTCLEEFKKGLKVCSFCQKDISSGAEGFLAPVGDKGTFKDFCTQACMEKYEQMSSNQPPPPQTHLCHVCNNLKLVEIEVFFENKINKLCSDICFSAYKFANNLTVDRCDMCKKYFDKDANGEKFNIFYEDIPHNFCSKTCMNVYILAKRKIVPCNWCKVKKYNFDMIKRTLSNSQTLMMCSLNCMTLYQVSVNAVSSRRIKCDMCLSIAQAQYHLTMSDATIRNFCTYPCVMNFQQQYTKSPITLPGSDDAPIPTGGPVPVISSVTSLTNGQPTTNNSISANKLSSGKLHLVTRLQEPVVCRNKNTQTRPIMSTKSVSCRPHSVSVSTQTDDSMGKPVLVPIPVPIYVPCPMAMYSFPYPVPVPFPLPIPVPIFLPTTRNSIKGIMKEIKRIQEKVPTDPLEAELLMMAEMVAADKKEEATSSESEPDNEPAADSRPNSDGEEELNSEPIESNNTFGEDIMQIALKMATELGEPDLETQLTPATIVNQSQSENSEDKTNCVETTKKTSTGEKRGRKRSVTKSPQKRNKSSDTKRKKANNSSDVSSTATTPVTEEPKPDANMKLKYTFGVNAWKSWVTQKNVEIEKLSSTNKKLKPLKTDILQLTVDELNFSLSMFVKEVQKPNGTQYAPDTIYYLCLGIQQYLYENGRIDNIFTDTYFESFTDSLDEVAKKFTELFNDHHYIVTRVEEEHLWESKQLGAHSPHVLLSTLLFFNTKHFNLTNVDEHLLLSFSHIMKHWKRNLNQSATAGSGKAPGSRSVLLRFYPPQAVLDDPNCKKKKVYEQLENEENPLRCPVKLYEFYLSKCPESVKTRSDVFYLQPERSCVPDSPVWYSTMALSKEPLDKMLNRVKMVKEINVALLIP